MRTHRSFQASPYLLLPLRTLEQACRDRCATRGEAEPRCDVCALAPMCRPAQTMDRPVEMRRPARQGHRTAPHLMLVAAE